MGGSESGGTQAGTESGGGETGGVGCGKIDFLFVVDNSNSMLDERLALAASVPAFIETIRSDVVGDYHVMVVDTDAQDRWEEQLLECPDECAGEPPDQVCGPVPPQLDWTCGALPQVDACGPILGAGLDHDGTDERGSCGILGGKRWFDASQPQPTDVFSCIADLYDGSGAEQVVGAGLAALEPSINAPDGCNAGFLRDDAILVVTFITDEDDAGATPGGPGEWKDSLLAAKGGNADALAVLALVGDTDLPGAVCQPPPIPGGTGAEYSPRLIEFAESFGPRGAWSSICAPDYGPFFSDAVELVRDACQASNP